MAYCLDCNTFHLSGCPRKNSVTGLLPDPIMQQNFRDVHTVVNPAAGIAKPIYDRTVNPATSLAAPLAVQLMQPKFPVR